MKLHPSKVALRLSNLLFRSLSFRTKMFWLISHSPKILSIPLTTWPKPAKRKHDGERHV